LAALANTDNTDIVHRGLHVHDKVVCASQVPTPPTDIQQQVEAQSTSKKTERQKAEERAAAPLCRGCHAAFDAYGVVLESYDAIGRYRTTLDGVPVETSFDIAGLGAGLDGRVSGVGDLSDRIRRSGRLPECATRHMAAYALGRDFGSADRCSLGSAEKRFATSGSFVDLFRGVALAPGFSTRLLSAGKEGAQ
jgi:hypothetical protein